MMVTRPSVDMALLTRGRETSLITRDHGLHARWISKMDEGPLYILHHVVRLD
jgi:hypothetical protein